jgi:hypothetical protein
VVKSVAGGRDRDDDPGPCVDAAPAQGHQFLDRISTCPSKLIEQLAPVVAEQRTQEAWDRENHVAVRDGQEYLLAQPLGPEQLLLLLARGAEAATAAGEGNQNAFATLRTPEPCEAVGSDILRLLGRSVLHLVKKVGLTSRTR